MIQRETVLNVADNSGAKVMKVIGIPGRSNSRTVGLGDLVTCTVKRATATGAVRTHQIVRAVLARTKKETRRRDGSYIRFDDNAAVVIDKDGNPVGTRILGPVGRELRERGYSKIASMATEVW
ncbi:50S ribosomal protein L14 [Candidatus Parcubacteria bacterium]|nr:50S ribosomal protein L14 [Candidatus Parcubacteria bacterium]